MYLRVLMSHVNTAGCVTQRVRRDTSVTVLGDIAADTVRWISVSRLGFTDQYLIHFINCVMHIQISACLPMQAVSKQSL